ncbi:hypothetical protein SLA2020_388500 [Shorea laevis]
MAGRAPHFAWWPVRPWRPESGVSSENDRFRHTEAISSHTHKTFCIQEHKKAHMVHDNHATRGDLHGSTWTSLRSYQYPKG